MLTASDDDAILCAGLAGLVIRRAKLTRRMTLDKIDRAAQLEVVFDYRNWIRDARRVFLFAFAIRESKRQLEFIWHPSVAGIGVTAKPFAQVRANRVDAVFPNLRNGGEQIVLRLGCDSMKHVVRGFDGPLDVAMGDGQLTRFSQQGQHLVLDLVKERTARERIDDFERGRFFAWLKPVYRLKKKPIRTRREILQRGRRKRSRC